MLADILRGYNREDPAKVLQTEVREFDVNSRLKLFIGLPGTGFCSRVLSYSDLSVDARNKIHMYDLLIDVDFVNGMAVYKDTPFIKAMKEGKIFVVDNLQLCSENLVRVFEYVTTHDKFEIEDNINNIHVAIDINPEFRIFATVIPSAYDAVIK